MKKYKSLFSTTLSTGIGTGTGDTITPASVSGLPTDTLITLTFDRVDSGGVATPTKLERIQGIISGGNFTSYTRGIDGTTEQAHTGGAVIEMIWNADDWNDAVTWGLTEHNQLGGHTNITASNITASATTSSLHYKVIAAGDFLDANGNELLKFTQNASAVNEFTVGNAVTGSDVTLSATGGDTNVSINLVSKGSGTVKVNGTAIATPTVATAAEVTTGTDNTKMVTPLAAQALGGANGWISAGTFTYATADSPTFTITVASGAASIYGVGGRIKLTQSTGGTKYFIVTVVADTVLTVYGGTDYTLNNEAITAPFYSHEKSPLGFPQTPAKWTVTTTDTSDRNQTNPVQNTWYNLGSISISGPIGVWNVRWFGNASFNRSAAGDIDQYGTLSTANNSESDTSFTTRLYLNNATGASAGLSRSKLLTLASKTTYYLNAKNASGSSTQINWLGSAVGPTVVEFVSAYL